MSDEYTANDLAKAIKDIPDGELVVGEIGYKPYDFGEYYLNAQEGHKITVPGLGIFTVEEAVVGLNTGSTDEYMGGYTEWHNWIVLSQRDRFFKLDGSYDSWDGRGWFGGAVEVERLPKTVYTWEKKLDY